MTLEMKSTVIATPCTKDQTSSILCEWLRHASARPALSCVSDDVSYLSHSLTKEGKTKWGLSHWVHGLSHQGVQGRIDLKFHVRPRPDRFEVSCLHLLVSPEKAHRCIVRGTTLG